MGFLRDVFSEKSLSYLMKVKFCLGMPSLREGLPSCLWPLEISPGHRSIFTSPLSCPFLYATLLVTYPVTLGVLTAMGGEYGVRGKLEIRCLCRFMKSFAIMRGKVQPQSCTAQWPWQRM